MTDHELPWKRGIGNESRKVWDKNGHLVCTLESSGDSTFLVECINKHAQLEQCIEGHRHDRVREAERIAQLETENSKMFGRLDAIAWKIMEYPSLDVLLDKHGKLKRLKEYATHQPGCYENNKLCICGLDILLAEEE